MITDLVIENFQSVKDATLKLGMLTLVTGPTGSGKSAVIRALHTAAFNRRGTAFIRHGAKSCKVAFGPQGEAWVIGIERGERGKDAYRVSRLPWHPTQPDGFLDEPVVDVYTKLGGEAPAEVLALHRLTRLNFAGQFDRPYLLDSSAGEVARILGELTNVSLVFEAARLANQRRLRAQGDLRRAEAEVASLTEQAQQYASLPARQAAARRAEKALSRALSLRQRKERLHVLITAAEGAAEASRDAQEASRAAAPPSLDRLEELCQRRDRLTSLLGMLQRAAVVLTQQEQASWLATRDEEQAHQAIHDALADAGTCPTCSLPVPR